MSGYVGEVAIGPGSFAAVNFRGEELLPGSMTFILKISDFEANCVNCGVHIHFGATCETIGSHYWNAAKTDDPWTMTKFNTTESGYVNEKFVVYSGFDWDDNLGHAVAVHASDGMAACGVLTKGFGAKKSKCP